jgi:hypothetical protein
LGTETGATNESSENRAVLQVATSPVEAVRRLEHWFFGPEGFSARKAIDYILEEAALCGSSNVQVDRVSDWWILSSVDDWLPSEEDGLSAFQALLPYPQAKPNGARVEILLTAFSEVVVTSKDGSGAVVNDRTGRGEGVAWLRNHREYLSNFGRVIAFREM